MSLALAATCVLSLAAADPVDDYVRAQMKARQLPGVSLAVVKDGRMVKAAGYGRREPRAADAGDHADRLRNRIDQQAVRRRTRSCCWSRTARSGSTTRCRSISTARRRAGRPITMRHVLTHTAGLADFDTGNIGFSYRREYTARGVRRAARQAAAAVRARRALELHERLPAARDGGRTRVGPAVHGLRRDSGSSRRSVWRRRDSRRAGDVVPHRADGYSSKDGAYRHGEPLRPGVIAPNGGVMINVLDFADVGHRDHQRPAAEAGERARR